MISKTLKQKYDVDVVDLLMLITQSRKDDDEASDMMNVDGAETEAEAEIVEVVDFEIENLLDIVPNIDPKTSKFVIKYLEDFFQMLQILMILMTKIPNFVLVSKKQNYSPIDIRLVKKWYLKTTIPKAGEAQFGAVF